MKKSFCIFIALLVTFYGCDRDEVSMPESHKCNYKGDYFNKCLEIEAGFASLKNCVYTEPVKARITMVALCEKIASIKEERISKKYHVKLLDELFAIPIDHLSFYERHHAVGAIRQMATAIHWPSMSKLEAWDIAIRLLEWMREELKKANEMPSNANWVKDTHRREYIEREDFIGYVAADLKNYSQWYEERLTTVTINEVSPEEYAVIKAKFEKFLGRPIRHYTEIHRARLEHARKMEQERERRRGGPDVKVDVGDL